MSEEKKKGGAFVRRAVKPKKSAGKVILTILIIVLILALLVFGALYLVVEHYRSKTDSTVRTGLSLEEILAEDGGVEMTTVTDENGNETKVLPEAEDEETKQIIADADAALAERAAAASQTAGSGESAETGETAGETTEEEPDIVNYLIIGSDRRPDGTIYGNSDVMIVVTINRTTHKIHLTSLMRAIYVTLYGCDYQGNGMLNWPFSMNGPEATVETIEKNFGIDIANYVVFDFTSVPIAIDALGGVTMEITDNESTFVSAMSKEPISGGLQTLTGAQALALARDRHIDNDFARTGRQRRILTACIESLKGRSISELNDLVNLILPYVQTDMSTMDIIAELPNVIDYVGYDIDQLMLPVENMDGTSYYGYTIIWGREMYVIDWDNNLTKMHEFMLS